MPAWAFPTRGRDRDYYQHISQLQGHLSGGEWGTAFHRNFYDLSLTVAPVDESIDTLARAFASGIPRMQNENGDLEDDHDLVRFLLEPNHNQNFKEFAKEFVRNLYASGYSYILPKSDNDANLRRLDKMDSNDRPEMQVLNTDCIDYSGDWYWFGMRNKRHTFKYNVDSTNTTYDFDDVIPFWDKVQDPKNYRVGVSRLHALKDEIENIILANRAKTNKIKQSGKFMVTPSTRSQNQIGNQLDQAVSADKPNYKQRDLLRDELQSSGLSQDKSITVTRDEMQVLNVMESIQNYSYDQEVKEDKRTVKNTFGIPKELQNVGDDPAKYENRKEAYHEMFNLSTIPLAANFTESIQKYYAPNEKKKLVLDYSHHPAFEIAEAKEEARIKMEIETLIMLFEKELVSREEIDKKLKANGII